VRIAVIAALTIVIAWSLRDVNIAGPVVTLSHWAPVIVKGFLFNLLIGALATLIGTFAGIVLGAAQLAPVRPVRMGAFAVTQLFRNSPWLVCLFYVMFLLPFEVRVAGVIITIPDWVKAVIGLSLPAMGNMSEIVRGGLRSIPLTQWEAGASLGYTRRQTILWIIIPQAARRMLPPWMNLYCIITMATSLANIVGVAEVMTAAKHLLVTENQPALLLPTYLIVMLMFFAYIYPLSRATRRLEQRWAVAG
jgi:polar amino acid transport system permease protein